MPTRDEPASVHVLEAIILALILLGAAHSVSTLRQSSTDTARPRAHLEQVAQDSMTILAGLEEGNGSLLDAYLLEAFHCAADPAPSQTSCQGTRSANLSLKVQSYLPPGAGYAIGLGNGVAVHDLYRSVLPPGETVSATFTYVPTWNLTFLVPELSCYEAGMEANVTALALRRGAVASLTSLGLRGAGDLLAAEPAHAPSLWNATVPADKVALAPTLGAHAQGRGGTFNGSVSLPTCELGGLGSALVGALRAASFSVGDDAVPVGSPVGFAADLGPLLAVPGASLVSANVTVYEPLPPRGSEPDTYVPAEVVEMEGAAGALAGAWDVPPDARLGVHPVVLKVSLQLPGGLLVEARRVDLLSVAMADGTVPIDPPYRAVLQVWFSDWR